jgi:beta-carotene 3-hydroxylase
MSGAVAATAAFLTMELVSYATHRWVMHGFAIGWHRSHHAPPAARLERNDRFPLGFSVVGVALFAAASLGPAVLWPIAVGVTAYGVAYLVVHEVVIHRRLPLPVPGGRYLGWLRDAHRDHHLGGGEPYGMLLPLVRHRPRRIPAVDPLDRRVVGSPRGRAGRG